MHTITREYTLNRLARSDFSSEDIRVRQISAYVEFTGKYGVKDWGEWHEKYDKIEDEWFNILEILDWCRNRERSYFSEILKIWKNVNNFADLYGHWSERVNWLTYIGEYAAAKGDIQLRFYSYSRLLWTHTMRLNFSEAQKVAAKGLSIISFSELLEQESFYHHLSVLSIRLGKYDEAEETLFKSKALLKELKDSKGIHEIDLCRRKLNRMYNIGKIYHHRNHDYSKAERCYKTVIQKSKEINWRRGQSYALYWLSECQIDQGRLEEARESINVGIKIAEMNNHRRREAYYHYALARLFAHRNEEERAKERLVESIEQFEYLNLIGFDKENSISLDDRINQNSKDILSRLSKIIYPPKR